MPNKRDRRKMAQKAAEYLRRLQEGTLTDPQRKWLREFIKRKGPGVLPAKWQKIIETGFGQAALAGAGAKTAPTPAGGATETTAAATLAKAAMPTGVAADIETLAAQMQKGKASPTLIRGILTSLGLGGEFGRSKRGLQNVKQVAAALRQFKQAGLATPEGLRVAFAGLAQANKLRMSGDAGAALVDEIGKMKPSQINRAMKMLPQVKKAGLLERGAALNAKIPGLLKGLGGFALAQKGIKDVGGAISEGQQYRAMLNEARAGVPSVEGAIHQIIDEETLLKRARRIAANDPELYDQLSAMATGRPNPAAHLASNEVGLMVGGSGTQASPQQIAALLSNL